MDFVVLVFIIFLGLGYSDEVDQLSYMDQLYIEPGGEVTLPCVLKINLTNNITDCAWMIGDNIIITSTRKLSDESKPDPKYQIIGSWENGICNLKISSVKQKDADTYSCITLPDKNNISKVDLIVEIKPGKPEIYYENKKVTSADFVLAKNDRQGIPVKCNITGGNPAAHLKWHDFYSSEDLNSTDINGTETASLLTLDYKELNEQGNKTVVCEAIHPSFSYENFSISVNVTIGLSLVKVIPEEAVVGQVLLCTIEGNDNARTFDWQRKESETWTKVPNDNIRGFIPNQEGEYRCLVKTTDSIDFIESINEASVTNLVDRINVIANDGSDIVLECKGMSGSKCIWTGIYPDNTSEVIQNFIRYTSTNLPESGDCSLNITDLKFCDAGLLTCEILAIQDTIIPDTIIGYNFSIGRKPTDPRIEYKNKIINDGDEIIIETPAEIKCVVEEGIPGADVSWENEDPNTVKVETFTIGHLTDVINTLTIDHFLNDSNPVKKISCAARHPLYPDENNLKEITITVGRAYPTGHVYVTENSKLKTCVPDGFPKPNVQWKYKAVCFNRWSVISHERNITLEQPGEYKCFAGNSLNGYDLIESENSIIHGISNEKCETNNVMIVSKDNELYPGNQYSCIADGHFPHKFQWLVNFPPDIEWRKFSSDQSIELTADANFKCRARNEHNQKNKWVYSMNTVSAKKNSDIARNGSRETLEFTIMGIITGMFVLFFSF